MKDTQSKGHCLAIVVDDDKVVVIVEIIFDVDFDVIGNVTCVVFDKIVIKVVEVDVIGKLFEL